LTAFLPSPKISKKDFGQMSDVKIRTEVNRAKIFGAFLVAIKKVEMVDTACTSAADLFLMS
jgi:hypothetical protein